jgi:hypothetical protein
MVLKSMEAGKDPPISPFNKHILSFPEIVIEYPLAEIEVLKEVIIKTPYLNQIISGYWLEILFVKPISNLNLFLIPQ